MKDSDLTKKKSKRKPVKASVKVQKPRVPKSTKVSSTLERNDIEALILLVQEQRRTIEYFKAELDFHKQFEEEDYYDYD